MKLILGDCLDKLKELDDNSVDSIVTDPPYGLSFMGKQWDYDVPSIDIWKECIRVLKPGGHLLSFAGSRTYHRMAVRIEDAGFEIRDQIMWIYGSGFPKSLNIGKGVDKKLGNERIELGRIKRTGKVTGIYGSFEGNNLESKGNSEWEGWGTALKPAHEPIVLARKPLSEKTVVDNVLEWGTGGINIDDSRIKTDESLKGGAYSHGNNRSSLNGDTRDDNGKGMFKSGAVPKYEYSQPIGRFPANVIFDEEAGKILDEQSGVSKSSGGRSYQNTNDMYSGGWSSKDEGLKQDPGFGDIGGASRFFYCPKTSKKDRNEGLDHLEDKYYAAGNQAKAELKRGNVEFNSNKGKGRDERHNHNQVGVSKNNHPTVKPTDLMLYLIRMVTPKGGTTLDPFMGSGSTGKAAVRGGFDFVGIEREKEYMEIAEARIKYEQETPYDVISDKRKEKVETSESMEETLNKFFG